MADNNEYDALIESEGEPVAQTQAPTGPSPSNEYESLVEDEAQSDRQALAQTVYQAKGKEPEKSAQVIQLSNKMNLSPDVVERQHEKITQEDEVRSYDKIVKEAPTVARWMADSPHNAAAAKDDLPKLTFLEKQINNIKNSFHRGGLTTELSDLGTSAFLGKITPEQRKRQEQIETEMSHIGDSGVTGFFEGVPGAIAEQLPILFKTTTEAAGVAATSAATGAAIGGAVGAVTGVGAIPAATAWGARGAFLGWRYGTGLSAAKMEGGLAFLDLEKIKDPSTGQPLAPSTARGGAMMVGAINGALETVGFHSIAKTIPGLKMLERQGLNKVLQNPTIRKVFMEAAQRIGSATGTEGATEFLQEMVTGSAKTLGGMVADGSIANASAADIISNIFSQENIDAALSAGRAGAQGGGGIAVAGSAVSLPGEMTKIKQAKDNAKAFDNLGKGIKDSKLIRRLPDQSQQIVKNMVSDSPLEAVHIPAETWNTYWQKQKNAEGNQVDPRDVAKEAGIENEYDEAIETGGDISIPTEKYAVAIAPTDHNAFFTQEIKTAPDALSAREAEELEASLDAEASAPLQEIEKSADQLRQEEEGRVLDEHIALAEKDLKGALGKAGFGEEVANQSSVLFQGLKTAYQRGNLTLDEVKQYVPQLQYMPEIKVQEEGLYQKWFDAPNRQEQTAKPLPPQVPVVEVTIPISENIKEAKEYGREQFQNKIVQNAHTEWAINMRRDELDKTLRGPNDSAGKFGKLVARVNLDKIIAGGVHVLTEPLHEKGITQLHTFYAPMKTPQNNYVVQYRIAEGVDGYKFHDAWVEKAPTQSGPGGRDIGVGFSDSLPIGDLLKNIKGVRQIDPLFQAAQDLAPAFYSKLTRTLEEKMPNAASPKDILGILREVKPEEMKWSGLEEFLKGKEKFSKPEVLEFLRMNQLEVKEVVKGGEATPELIRDVYGDDGNYYSFAQVIDENGEPVGEPLINNGPFETEEAAEADISQNLEMAERALSGGTKFSKYVLPGGENYREVLFTLPVKTKAAIEQRNFETWALEEHGFNKDIARMAWEQKGKLYDDYIDLVTPKKTGKEFKSSHFDDPNVLAHTRLNDRTDADGKRVLFVEEIQSDWHQEGRKKGYSGDEKPFDQAEFEVLSEKINSAAAQAPDTITNPGKRVPWAIKEGLLSQAEYDRMVELNDLKYEGAATSKVPDAPFRKTWHEFVMKRIIRMAAEQGYDRVAWTTGEQQAERYDLSKQVDEVGARKNPDGTWRIMVFKGDDMLIDQGTVAENEIESVVGKDLAQKIIAEEGKPKIRGGKERYYSGVDLKIGGEGMKGFYDKILVDYANKLGKKFGAKVGATKLGGAGKATVWDSANNEAVIEFDSVADAQAFIDEQGDPDLTVRADKKLSGDSDSQKVHSLEITPEMKKSALAEGFPLFQGKGKGRIRFGASGPTIDLSKLADESTFMHEMGHLYLELMRTVGLKDSANEQAKADSEAILKWLGIENWDQLETKHHEQFAEGFEKYLSEGKAPSRALQTAFYNFRTWLKNLWSQIQGTQVEISDEMRQIFDRILATDQEIEDAQLTQAMEPLFANPTDVGMNEKEATRYIEASHAAKQAAEEELTAKQMEELRRVQQKYWKDAEKEYRAQFLSEVNQTPIYIAISMMGKGVMPDGSPLPNGMKQVKLSRNVLNAEYGKEVMAGLPRPYVYAKEGGTHPDIIGGLFGFGSGEEFITALINTKPQNAYIEERVRAAMKAKFGDMVADGTIQEEAQKAVHNDQRGKLLEKELKYLISKEFATFKGLAKKISKPVPTVEAIRMQAERIIMQKRVRDIKPQAYLHAERKASREAMDAFLKGDFALAFDAKQKQLLNHELYRAATNAKEKIDTIVKDSRRFSEDTLRAKIGKAGSDYLEQIDDLLERFSFRPIPLKQVDKNKSLDEWYKGELDKGYQPLIPSKLLNEAFKTNYKDLSYQDLSDIHDTLESIEHIALLKNKLLANQKLKSKEAAIEEMIGSMGANHDLTKPPADLAPGFKDKLLSGLKEKFASHTKAEFIFSFLDGHKALGSVWRNIFQPIAEAEAKEQEMQKGVAENMKRILKDYTVKERRDWYSKRIFVPEAKTAKMNGNFTKGNIISVALNWGNDSNRLAIMEGYGWSEDQVSKVLSHMTEKDWKMVQDTWDYIDTFWPEIAAQERVLNGLVPEKVVAAKVKTPFGELRGGYYPLVYDAKLSYRQSAVEQEKSVEEIFGGSFARAATKKGHTIERTNSGGKAVKLDVSVISNHLSNVVHDLAFRRAVIDVHGLINNPEMRGAIESAAGMDLYKQLNPWLVNVAGDRNANNGLPIERILARARSGATIVNMGLKLTTALIQPLGYTNSVKEIGAKYGMIGLQDVFAKGMNPARSFMKAYQFASERSKLIQNRMQDWDRDVRDTLKGADSLDKVSGAFLYHIGFMDLCVSLPTWMGAYRQAMDGQVETVEAGDEKDAILYADNIVRVSQGAGTPKDRAQIQNGSESFKLFTMFYSFFSVQYNQFQKTAQQYTMDRSLPKLMSSLALLWFIPAVLEGLALGRAPTGDDEEDGELLKWMIRKEITYPFGSMIFVRDIVNAADRSLDTGRVEFEGSPAFDALESFVKTLAVGAKTLDEDSEISRQDVKDVVMAGGYMAGLPSRQMWLTGEYMYEWMTGEQEPENYVEAAWRATVTGKKRDK